MQAARLVRAFRSPCASRATVTLSGEESVDAHNVLAMKHLWPARFENAVHYLPRHLVERMLSTNFKKQLAEKIGVELGCVYVLHFAKSSNSNAVAQSLT
jgi:hypothetical protein